jgi:hypothetical protein
MQRQRRQRELIDHACFITGTKVTDILLMRDVGFRNEQAIGERFIKNGSPELIDLVHLWKMNTAAIWLLPEKTDSIQTDRACATGGIFQQDRNALQKDFRSRKFKSI